MPEPDHKIMADMDGRYSPDDSYCRHVSHLFVITQVEFLIFFWLESSVFIED